MYYTYMLRCTDGSIYTGIASDLEKRTGEHLNRSKRCAKYTLTHPAERLAAAWQSESRSAASRLEYRIKRLTKAQKERLIEAGDLSVFSGLIDENDFVRVIPGDCMKREGGMYPRTGKASIKLSDDV